MQTLLPHHLETLFLYLDAFAAANLAATCRLTHNYYVSRPFTVPGFQVQTTPYWVILLAAGQVVMARRPDWQTCLCRWAARNQLEAELSPYNLFANKHVLLFGHFVDRILVQGSFLFIHEANGFVHWIHLDKKMKPVTLSGLYLRLYSLSEDMPVAAGLALAMNNAGQLIKIGHTWHQERGIGVSLSKLDLVTAYQPRPLTHPLLAVKSYLHFVNHAKTCFLTFDHENRQAEVVSYPFDQPMIDACYCASLETTFHLDVDGRLWAVYGLNLTKKVTIYYHPHKHSLLNSAIHRHILHALPFPMNDKPVRLKQMLRSKLYDEAHYDFANGVLLFCVAAGVKQIIYAPRGKLCYITRTGLLFYFHKPLRYVFDGMYASLVHPARFVDSNVQAVACLIAKPDSDNKERKADRVKEKTLLYLGGSKTKRRLLFDRDEVIFRIV